MRYEESRASSGGESADGGGERPAGEGVRYLDATEDDAGQRLDNYLIRSLKGVPRSRIYRIVRKGEVRINGKRAKPEQRLEAGDKVRIPPIRTSAEAPQ